MPDRAPTPCRAPSCGETVATPGLCPTHKRLAQRQQDARRGSAHQRGYTPRWSAARAAYLRRHPTCVRCAINGLLVPANVVDHITPHRGDKTLFWDHSNWQSLCTPCHNRKTAREDGGIGSYRGAGSTRLDSPPGQKSDRRQ